MALNLKVISKKALETVAVDSTVQPKAIAHLTDSRLLEVAREKLVAVAKNAGISLKQTFANEGKQLARKVSIRPAPYCNFFRLIRFQLRYPLESISQASRSRAAVH